MYEGEEWGKIKRVRTGEGEEEESGEDKRRRMGKSSRCGERRVRLRAITRERKEESKVCDCLCVFVCVRGRPG